MRTLTVRLPEALAAEIEAESRERGISKSDIVRERLERAPRKPRRTPPSFAAIADLVGSIDDGLPSDLSARYKHYLKTTGYGRRRPR
jgi:Arc/MetJ-type ribon-helix-helix transcriptional regulator